MPRWKYRTLPPVPSFGLGLSPIVEQLIASRSGETKDKAERFLFPNYDRDLHDPFLFSSMERVVERIALARERDETIGLFGDFDADGVTSSVILHTALRHLGFDPVIYLPHKINEGHGYNLQAVDHFERTKVTLVLTLDCGMMNHAEIAEAKRRGIDTIIIDHHHTPEVLPEAYAIVNPKLPSENYPFRELCGAGTSFKVATALYRRLASADEEQLKWLLDVAAIGTIADVMPLLGENRAIVKYGLVVLQKTRRAGLLEMFAVGRIPIGEQMVPDVRLVAFHIAPRLNSASRMAHPMLAHDLLMAPDRVQARGLALELEAYNVARQKVGQETTALVRRVAEEQFADRKFILAVDEHYPLGVIGLVAGKIADQFGKPTCILQRGATTSTGSFRSIPGLNIIELLEQCADLVEKYGGHAQAAGMRIRNDHLPTFHERFESLVEQALSGVMPEPEIEIDAVLRPNEISLTLARELKRLEPCGEGNREPIFALQGMHVLEARTVGKDGQHWKFKLKNGGAPETFDAVGWSLVADQPDIIPGETIDVAFTLSENSWNGSTTLQLKLVDIHREG